MKVEAFSIFNPKKLTCVQMERIVWNYFTDYWNNRRIYSADDGFPPAVKIGVNFLKMEEMVA